MKELCPLVDLAIHTKIDMYMYMFEVMYRQTAKPLNDFFPIHAQIALNVLTI